MTEEHRKTITLLRHGLSTANHEGVLQGQKDFPLHSRGFEQAQYLAAYWADQGHTFDQIITSPLQRARKTADAIAAKLSIPTIEDPIWLERSFGEGEGLKYSQIQTYLLENSRSGSINESILVNGETEVDLRKRASLAVNSLVTSEKQVVLVVSHGGFLGEVMRYILGIPLAQSETRPPSFRFDNTGFSEVAFHPETSQWQVLVHNAKPHLEINPW